MADPRLTDEEIHRVATRIRDAMRRPLSSSTGAPAGPEHTELGREDEARVTAALSAMHDRPAPGGSDHTAAGTPTRTAQGYGTAQGASGATAGGADPGGSTGNPPD